MIADRVRAGIATGLIAAAGTAGVLAGLGARRGPMALHFGSLGASLVQGALARDGSTAIIGFVLHVTLVVLWAMLFSFVARTLRGGVLAVSGVAFAGFVYLVNVHFIAPPFRLGFAGPVAPGELLAFYIVLGASLVAGTRLAF
ncbi:MAG: hypothetical protein NVS4B3_17410 [Gemmatimonadaceae bacterium]